MHLGDDHRGAEGEQRGQQAGAGGPEDDPRRPMAPGGQEGDEHQVRGHDHRGRAVAADEDAEGADQVPERDVHVEVGERGGEMPGGDLVVGDEGVDRVQAVVPILDPAVPGEPPDRDGDDDQHAGDQRPDLHKPP